MPILQGPVVAIMSHTTVPDQRPSVSPTLAVTTWLTWDPPTNILQKTFWVSGSNEPRVYGKFQASIPGQLQKCSPQGSTLMHTYLYWESNLAQLGVQASESQRWQEWPPYCPMREPHSRPPAFTEGIGLSDKHIRPTREKNPILWPLQKIWISATVTRACLNNSPGRK